MSPLYVLIALGYVNGDLVQTESGAVYTDIAPCVKEARASAEETRVTLPSKVQVVYKCVDISQVPVAVSVFGSK
jgi:hypothetical protein